MGGNETGNSAALRVSQYQANNLNQLVNRTVPRSIDVIGAAPTAATVTVNEQEAYRHGSYYRHELAVGDG